MTSIKEVFGDGHEEQPRSSGATGDTPVSMSQFNQVLNQLAHMQQETVQNVHHMQSQLQQLLAHPQDEAKTQGGTVHQPQQPLSGVVNQPSHTPVHVPPSSSVPSHIKLAKPSLFTGVTKANVETWIFEVEQYLSAYGISVESQKIAFASASFKGMALHTVTV